MTLYFLFIITANKTTVITNNSDSIIVLLVLLMLKYIFGLDELTWQAVMWFNYRKIATDDYIMHAPRDRDILQTWMYTHLNVRPH